VRDLKSNIQRHVTAGTSAPLASIVPRKLGGLPAIEAEPPSRGEHISENSPERETRDRYRVSFLDESILTHTTDTRHPPHQAAGPLAAPVLPLPRVRSGRPAAPTARLRRAQRGLRPRHAFESLTL